MKGGLGMRSLLRAVVITVLVGFIGASGSASATKKSPPGNPPGNNGTIKVGADADPEPNNEPHVDGCRLWIEFFGFDTGERVRITFETQPPTGQGDLLLTHEAVISDDPAAGGQDADAVLGFNLSEALQSFEPHPKQGYHVKVRSDSLNAPGGAKQKVFWLNCNPAPASAVRVTKAVEGSAKGPFLLMVRCNHAPADQDVSLAPGESRDIPVPLGTTCAVTEPDPRGASDVRFTESAGDGTEDGQVIVTGEAPATVVVTNVFPEGTLQPAAVPDSGTERVATEVAGVSETAPVALDTLPRTGGASDVLIRVGAWVLAAGGLTLFAGRRR
ncbi:MAG: DUF5979 domain-containing protein [Acidimicrobiia bacterium]